MEEKKLFEDNDEFLVKQIESILKEDGIPYIRKDEGVGSYMNVAYGQSFGLSKAIYVSNEDYEKAQNAIQIFKILIMIGFVFPLLCLIIGIIISLIAF